MAETPLKLLIVDDSAIVRKVLIKTIKLANVPIGEIYQAGNGEEALKEMSSHPVDLIFLDINMPTMNGMEFMHRLRQLDQGSDTPVIVVSTEGSRDRREELFSLGVKAFLRKPITPEELTSTIDQVMETLHL